MSKYEEEATEYQKKVSHNCQADNCRPCFDIVEAFKAGANYERERAEKLVEAAKLVIKFGYGVNIEKNLEIRNTGELLDKALASYESKDFILDQERGEL